MGNNEAEEDELYKLLHVEDCDVSFYHTYKNSTSISPGSPPYWCVVNDRKENPYAGCHCNVDSSSETEKSTSVK